MQKGITCHGYFSTCATLKQTHTITKGGEKETRHQVTKKCIEESEENTRSKQCDSIKGKNVENYKCGMRTCKVQGDFCNDLEGDDDIVQKKFTLACKIK